MSAKTLFARLWELHVVKPLGEGYDLLHIDRHFVHDLCAPCFDDLAGKGRTVRNPELTLATADHAVSTRPDRAGALLAGGGKLIETLRAAAVAYGFRNFEIGGGRHGIVHVIGPETGLTLPGATIVCGDSHTCTQGALGALAFGIGSSEIVHVLATQTLVQRRPATMRVLLTGRRGFGVEAKDIILALIGAIGTDGGAGHAIEYAGPVVEAMTIEERMTICNLSVEFGAKIGFIAPDETTFAYLKGRPHAPEGADWLAALAHWRTLKSDPDAVFDREITLDVTTVAPQVTWGTSPQDVVPVTATIPDPEREAPGARREAMRAALDYMGLQPGAPINGLPIDYVFIGSCTNGRLSDLRAAAGVLRGRGRVPAHVAAWVVPGSEEVKRAAEAEGLDAIFRAAGFDWRQPGCSMCLAANGETVPSGKRAVSTSNRNFVGRQGPGARTHLASPIMAAAAALAGRIVDVREMGA